MPDVPTRGGGLIVLTEGAGAALWVATGESGLVVPAEGAGAALWVATGESGLVVPAEGAGAALWVATGESGLVVPAGDAGPIPGRTSPARRDAGTSALNGGSTILRSSFNSRAAPMGTGSTTINGAAVVPGPPRPSEPGNNRHSRTPARSK